MNKKEIEDLIKFVSKAGVSEVSLELKDIKITIKNSAQKMEQAISHIAAPTVIPIAIPQIAAPVIASASKAEAPKAASVEESKYVTIKVPIIGDFIEIGRASCRERVCTLV